MTVEYLAAQRHLLAPSYHSSQALHLRHLLRYLGDRSDRITFRDLDGYIQLRVGERHPNTAERERITLRQFFNWIVRRGYLSIQYSFISWASSTAEYLYRG